MNLMPFMNLISASKASIKRSLEEFLIILSLVCQLKLAVLVLARTGNAPHQEEPPPLGNNVEPL